MKKLRIQAKRDAGFRRCGVAHPATPVDHNIDRFSEEEIEILKAEPGLFVQEVDVEDPPKETGKKNT